VGNTQLIIHYTLHASDVAHGAHKAEVHQRGRKGGGGGQ